MGIEIAFWNARDSTRGGESDGLLRLSLLPEVDVVDERIVYVLTGYRISARHRTNKPAGPVLEIGTFGGT